MTFIGFSFEYKALMDSDWSIISEDVFMDHLYKTYNRLSPIIKELLDGKEVHTHDGAFRIVRG